MDDVDVGIEPGTYSLEEAAGLGVYDPLSGHVVGQEGLVIFKACSGTCGCVKGEQTCVIFVRRKRIESE
ncbi:hypothetical protein [Candidatus Promineifilum breve]|uniref:hypothetical protein n=1 Tax=Candidatus Promineifilum breve TaxID=1806508 RepID=UPI0012FFB1CE|nr:hypothetical protein [Candidatus Promineifilum breve]